MFLWPGIFKNSVTMALTLSHLHMQLARRSPSPKKKTYFTQLKLGLLFPLERLSLVSVPARERRYSQAWPEGGAIALVCKVW